MTLLIVMIRRACLMYHCTSCMYPVNLELAGVLVVYLIVGYALVTFV